jgi:hypothetical protein
MLTVLTIRRLMGQAFAFQSSIVVSLTCTCSSIGNKKTPPTFAFNELNEVSTV